VSKSITAARIAALRKAGEACPFQVAKDVQLETPGQDRLHHPMESCETCEHIADSLETFAADQTMSLRSQLQDAKDIGRAKGKMQAELGFTEQEAHRYIQTTAMNTRRSMGTVAREIRGW